MLGISIAIWVALGVWRLLIGLTWIDRARLVGTTQAYSDITLSIIFFVVAVATAMLARLVYVDIVQVFAQRRFKVPREKLLVYGILALPFGFIVSGSLLLFVNIKLSHPDFLPSHAEAYPDAMPGFVQVPRAMLMAEAPMGGPEDMAIPGDAPAELAPLGFDDVPVSVEEAQPAAEFFSDDPGVEHTYQRVPEVVPQLASAPTPVPTPVPAITDAYVEEVPEEEIPEVVAEVVAEVAPVTEAPVVAAYEEVGPPTEEGPVEAVVEAVVEDVTDDDESGFEMVEEEVPSEEPEGPQTIEEAHEDLLDKLLGK